MHRVTRPATRRQLLAASTGAGLTLALGCRQLRAAGEIRVGFQKGSATLLVLKSSGDLEKQFGELGYTVTWTEFPAALPLLDAMNAGSIDFGNTGAAPVIFSQAADTDLIYAVSSASSPLSQGIIVPADSPIQRIEDLKGKTVALAKGSISVALAVAALESVGLAWEDVEPAFLLPSDAKAAFNSGSVDAWTIWDPYYALEEGESSARTIATNGSVGFPNRGFYLADRRFATENADALAVITAALREAETRVDEHTDAIVATLATETGLAPEVLRVVEERRVHGLEPVTTEIVAGQQQLADLFFWLGFIPTEVDVAAATLPGLETFAT
ncbi:MAG: aliphatic sulfonate ABC transporter substrate-binding protein [Thermomicrobiales bacterium]